MATIEAHNEVREAVRRKQLKRRQQQMFVTIADQPIMTDWRGAHRAAAEYLNLKPYKLTIKE